MSILKLSILKYIIENCQKRHRPHGNNYKGPKYIKALINFFKLECVHFFIRNSKF